MNNKPAIKLFLTATILTFLGACGGGDSGSTKTQKSAKPIVIIGPSTVYISQEISKAHYPDNTDCKLQGWGEKLQDFTQQANVVYNYARPGSGAGTFKLSPDKSPEDSRLYGPKRDHYWAKAKEKMQSLGNGILLIQFGGNDPRYLNEKYPFRNAQGTIIDYNKDGQRNFSDNDTRWDIMRNAFRKNLKFYIDEADKLGYTPVLITSPEKRIRESNGKISNNRGDWPTTMKQLATAENVRLLDLHKKTLDEYNKHTDEELDELFGGCINGWSGKKENTHYDPDGAKLVASWVKELACEQSDSELCQQFK